MCTNGKWTLKNYQPFFGEDMSDVMVSKKTFS